MARKKILDAFNIEQSELRNVILLLIHSLFLGIFYGGLDISAHTLFLKMFPEAFIAKAYTFSGVAGIIFTFIYSKSQQKFSFRFLSIFSLVVLSGITIGLWECFNIWGVHKYLVFAVFILLGPLNIVAIVNFWAVVGRLFSLRQGKRLFGLIGAGQIFGTILISYFIPLISVLKLNIKTEDLILFAGISLFFAAFAQGILTRYEKLEVSDHLEKESKVKNKFIKLLKKDKYIQVMIAYVVLSMIILFFIAFTFLAAAQQQYPEEQDMKSFLGIFSGTMMIFGFLLKTLVYSKIMKTYGLRVALLVLPIILLLLSVIIIIVFNSTQSTFIIIFLLLSMNRLFSMSIRDAIEIPAFKTLYQSLPPSIRFDVQSKIDGTTNELSALAAGLILTVLGLFFTLISYIYTLIFLLVLWILTGLKLYKEYKVSLQNTLASFESEKIKNETISKNRLTNFTNSKFKFLVNTNPQRYKQELVKSLKYMKEEELVKNIDYILSKEIFFAIPYLEKLKSDGMSSEAHIQLQESIYKLKVKIPKIDSTGELLNLIKTGQKKEIITICRFLRYKSDNLFLPIVLLLLRDLNPEIKSQAIITAAYFPKEEIIRFLVEELQNDSYRSLARNSLKIIGEKACNALIVSFNKNIDKPEELEEIISLLYEIKPTQITPFLIANFNFYHRKISKWIIRLLIEMDVILPEEKFREFQQAVEKKAQLYAWNFEALQKAKQENMPDFLVATLTKELSDAFDEFFDLLALRYDKNSIFQIKKNILSQNSEEIGYAIELLDLFIDEELKPIIFPLLDDIAPEEKTFILSEFFTISVMDNPLLVSILGRGANYLSKWTILCTLMTVLETKNTEISINAISAHAYNPNKTLRNAAILVLKRNFPDSYERFLNNFSTNEKIKINQFINQIESFPLSLSFYLTLFLQKLFINFDFTETELLKWLEEANYKATKEKLTLNFTPFDQRIFIFMIKGEIEIYQEFKHIKSINKIGKGILINLEENLESYLIDILPYTEVLIFDSNSIRKLSAKNKSFLEYIELSEKI